MNTISGVSTAVLFSLMFVHVPTSATADQIDLGVVALSLQDNERITGLPGLDVYTVDALVFVGQSLNLKINGQAVSDILTSDLGGQTSGAIAFNFPDFGSAGALFNDTSSLSVSSGHVVFSSGTWTVGSFFSGTIPGNPVGQTLTVAPLDPAGTVTAMAGAGLVILPAGTLTDTGLISSSTSAQLGLGCDTASGHCYFGEVPSTAYTSSASFSPAVGTVPEPGTLVLMGTAIGVVVRRKRGRRGSACAAASYAR
jgi:hypothetical protein